MADCLIYRTQTGARMRAIVRTRHRDGDFTVEPYFYVGDDGKDSGMFQGGHKLRIGPEHVLEHLTGKNAPRAK